MQGKPPAALGSGAYVAGVAATVMLLAGSGYDAVAAVGVAGLCLGIVAGGLVVTRTQLLSRSVTSRVAALVLVALGTWVTWTGIQRGAGGSYQLTIGSVFFGVVGWAVMVGRDETPGGAETLATLPRTTEGGGDGRRRQFELLVDAAVLVVVAGLFVRGAVLSTPSSWLFGGLFLVVFLPGTRSRVRLTDGGLVTTRYVCWLVPFDQTHTPWTQVYGYEGTGDRLRIATEFGPDLTYDLDGVPKRERVVGILDERVPRL